MLNPQFSTWPAEKAQLAKLLLASPGKYAIEIGCFRGVTSLLLAEACKTAGKTLICIDPWNNSQDWSDDSVYYYFLETIKEHRDRVVVIRATSDKAVNCLPSDIKDSGCGFMFVDGDHSYEGAKKDLANYYPLLSGGGVMAVHDVFDTGWKGVGQAVEEFIKPGMSVFYHKYRPTAKESGDYQHGVSGLAWFYK